MSDCSSLEDGDDHGILKKALDVELPSDFNPNKIPQTGEEYLHHVIYERSKCKTWVTADIDRSKFQEKQTFKVEVDYTFKKSSKAVLPAIEWQKQKLEDFTNFRKFIYTKISDEPNVVAFNEDVFLVTMQEEHPKLSEVITYSQAAKIRMLQIISKFIDSVQSGMSIEENLGSWIFALLVLLEKPLSPSSCHTLREFAKKCLVIRSKLARFFNQLDLADS